MHLKPKNRLVPTLTQEEGVLQIDISHSDNFAERPSDNFLIFLWSTVNTFLTDFPTLCLSQSSPYPLILSLENHCSLEQQKVMARYLHSILGDKLLTKPLEGLDSHNLPSPEVSSQGISESSVHITTAKSTDSKHNFMWSCKYSWVN